MKIRPEGAELFHADERTGGQKETYRRTDMTNLTIAFINFANVLKMIILFGLQLHIIKLEIKTKVILH
jgi:hypothetical protein